MVAAVGGCAAAGRLQVGAGWRRPADPPQRQAGSRWLGQRGQPLHLLQPQQQDVPGTQQRGRRLGNSGGQKAHGALLNFEKCQKDKQKVKKNEEKKLKKKDDGKSMSNERDDEGDEI